MKKINKIVWNFKPDRTWISHIGWSMFIAVVIGTILIQLLNVTQWVGILISLLIAASFGFYKDFIMDKYATAGDLLADGIGLAIAYWILSNFQNWL